MEVVLIEAVLNSAFNLQGDSSIDILDCIRQVLSKHSVKGNKWLLSDYE